MGGQPWVVGRAGNPGRGGGGERAGRRGGRRTLLCDGGVQVPFSRRVPRDLRPNRIAEALAKSGPPAFDLTVSNPTACGIPYPDDLLAAARGPGGAALPPRPPRAARGARGGRRRVPAARRDARPGPHRAHGLDQRGVCVPLQAAVRARGDGADAAAVVPAVRAPRPRRGRRRSGLPPRARGRVAARPRRDRRGRRRGARRRRRPPQQPDRLAGAGRRRRPTSPASAAAAAGR